MSRRFKFAVLASAVLGMASPAAATVLIDFDSFTAMGNAPGAAVPLASRLGTQFLGSLGVRFQSGAGFVAIVDHVPGCPVCTPTAPNIIAGTASDGTLNYGSAITADFFSTANPAVKAKTGFVRVLGDKVPLGFGSVILEAYGRTGNLLGTVSAADVGPVGTGADLSLTIAGIHSVRFYSDNRTVGFDNFEFGALSTVPEPATWALMIAGFGLVGTALRRRTAATASLRPAQRRDS